MKKEHIQTLLETVCEYNNVRITQTFFKDDTEGLLVKCIPNTRTLELTYLQTGTVKYYESIKEAVEVIYNSLYSSMVF